MRHLSRSQRLGRRHVLALVAAVALTVFPAAAAAATVQATAEASQESTYVWTVEKTADTTQVTLGPGQSTTVNYTVTATPALASTSWSASGEIVVVNDQQSAQLLEAVAASVAGVGPADVACPDSVDLPYLLDVAEEVTCAWSIVLPDAATRVVTTTATVNGVEHSAPATIDFASASESAVDACADVYDLNVDFLGTICADAGPTTFEFPVTFGPFEECVDREIENVAWVETADTQTVAEDFWTFTALCDDLDDPNERTYHWKITKTVNKPKVSLEPGETRTVTYTVTVSSTGFTDSDPGAGETVEIDECVEVTDTLAGALGTVCADDQPKTFTYTRTVGPYTTCGPRTIPNTATYRGTDTGATGQASAQVDVDVKCSHSCPTDKGKNHGGHDSKDKGGHDSKDKDKDHGSSKDKDKGGHDSKDKDKDHGSSKDKDKGGHDSKDKDKDHGSSKDKDKGGHDSKDKDKDHGSSKDKDKGGHDSKDKDKGKGGNDRR